ncbi:hypothetical protein YC2023_082672 [Brassica napus]
MRVMVIQRKYWHIADIPLVVNVWSPQEALNPLDLSSMPLWVDLRGVPNNLYSHKGLKCLCKATGKFVKLHPTTEKCVRLDVARVLVKVNLHQELVEKISFQDKEGNLREIEVAYPWLPPWCSGHKGQDCLSKDVRILRKQSVHGGGSEFATVSQDEDIVGRKEGNVIEDLLHNLEAVTPQAAQKALLVSNVALSGSETVMPSLEKDLLPKMKEDMQTIELIEPKTEGFLAVGCWEAGHGKMQGGNCVEDEVLVVSPSRFSPLQDIEEDEEEIVEEFAKEMEEGETLEGKTEGKSSQNPQVASRGMKTTNGSTQKQARSRVIHTRDLLHVGKQGTTKKSSVRKI